jgi:hypothetical protein
MGRRQLTPEPKQPEKFNICVHSSPVTVPVRLWSVEWGGVQSAECE